MAFIKDPTDEISWSLHRAPRLASRPLWQQNIKICMELDLVFKRDLFFLVIFCFLTKITIMFHTNLDNILPHKWSSHEPSDPVVVNVCCLWKCSRICFLQGEFCVVFYQYIFLSLIVKNDLFLILQLT